MLSAPDRIQDITPGWVLDKANGIVYASYPNTAQHTPYDDLVQITAWLRAHHPDYRSVPVETRTLLSEWGRHYDLEVPSAITLTEHPRYGGKSSDPVITIPWHLFEAALSGQPALEAAVASSMSLTPAPGPDADWQVRAICELGIIVADEPAVLQMIYDHAAPEYAMPREVYNPPHEDALFRMVYGSGYYKSSSDEGALKPRERGFQCNFVGHSSLHGSILADKGMGVPGFNHKASHLANTTKAGMCMALLRKHIPDIETLWAGHWSNHGQLESLHLNFSAEPFLALFGQDMIAYLRSLDTGLMEGNVAEAFEALKQYDHLQIDNEAEAHALYGRWAQMEMQLRHVWEWFDFDSLWQAGRGDWNIIDEAANDYEYSRSLPEHERVSELPTRWHERHDSLPDHILAAANTPRIQLADVLTALLAHQGGGALPGPGVPQLMA
ncbi:hypothetical protein GC177_03040 [bacterium]|nr:hypothetical protein [bacterium]